MPCGVDDKVERGNRTGNVSREGGGLKMRQRRSLGSGTGDTETVPSEPEGVAGTLRRRRQHQCARVVELYRSMWSLRGTGL
jgi:hypothetical protein